MRRRIIAAEVLALVAISLTGLHTVSARTASGAKLIADAGDSAFVEPGEGIVLGGMAWGGRAPYRFAWSHRGEAERFTASREANTTFRTDGLAEGDHVLDLTVTDAGGSTARDIVKIRLYTFDPQTILSETGNVDVGVPDELLFDPGADSPDGQTKEFPLAVPAGVRALDLELSWGTYVGNPAAAVNDLDLYVSGPDPAYAENSGGATADIPEHLHIDRPKAGAYTAIVAAFATIPDTFELRGRIVREPLSPVPSIDVPATVRFTTGEAQRLRAAAAGDVRWDLDFDGVYERHGASTVPSYRKGAHLATVKAVRDGFEARKTVAVRVIDRDEVASNTTPFVVVGIGDSGINPYHDEFSAASYPDPQVLELTDGFSRHPSEYIPGYPRVVPAIPMTTGKGYLPDEDEDLWTRDRIDFQRLYWIPGTKIIGAIDWTDSSGSNAADDTRPILDDDGHGTGSSSVSVGNRYGNCPACLLVFAEGLSGDEFLVTNPWIDIVSMSVGTVGNVGFGVFTSEHTKVAAERGQSVLFAAGNGFGNAFDVPMSTYTSANAGPDWHVVVGAARTDNRRPIIGDANPVDISSWGDGTIPSACIAGTVSMCNFGGTSAATPLTAGVFGHVLREVRRAVGDVSVGQRPGQIVATGRAIPASDMLRDGKMTRAEFWDLMFHSAQPFGEGGVPMPPYTHTWPGPESEDYLFGGYGLATPDSAEMAVAIALGRAQMPVRETEDAFFEFDATIRQQLWGDWNDGTNGSAQAASAARAASGVSFTDVVTAEDALRTIAEVARSRSDASLAAATASKPVTYWLHHAGGCPAVDPPAGPDLEPHAGYTSMDRVDRAGDDEPCPNSRATTVAAYYRPVGIWSSEEPVGTDLPEGSRVEATLYITMDHPMLVEATGFLLAGKRTVGRGGSAPTPVADVAAARCAVDLETCWTEIPIGFETSRPIGSWERLTFQVAIRSSENTFFGYEGTHASRVSIVPATGAGAAGLSATITSLDDGDIVSASGLVVSGSARFADVESESFRAVELSIDDPTFANPVAATTAGDLSWAAKLPLGAGQHTIYARSRQDRRVGAVDAVAVFAGTVPAAPTLLPQTGLGDRAGVGFLVLASAVAAIVRRRSFRIYT